MLLSSIKNAYELQRKCQLLVGRARKIKDQSKITITLIAIVFFYLIGEVPTHLTARKTAANLLFAGDHERADDSVMLEIFRQVTTALNSLHLASKFILYCLFCPPFCRALKKTITGTSKKKEHVEARNMPISLFVCDKHMDRRFKLDINELAFMNIFINTKAAQELPRIL
ncbi:hypothetical protein ILUMI_25403 [Ignelater luminosus]|uniref:Uncharacterized protein n=1 Tax=Ignelater luminosus TaxID=2038154 RepID=A0A8K0C4U4_IGNLU|nr:hypothetical protein ILUMI_25403 [Ignelater luminosus]